MEVTKEVKAKVFALYMGAEVQNSGNIGHRHDTLKMLCIEHNSQNTFVFVPGGYAWHIEDCQLILHDLRDIADEDALEICRMADYESDSKGEMLYIGRGIVEYHFENFVPYKGRYDTWATRAIITGLRCWSFVRIADFLRDPNKPSGRAYMLPYNGIDLFEAGIAKRKEV